MDLPHQTLDYSKAEPFEGEDFLEEGYTAPEDGYIFCHPGPEVLEIKVNGFQIGSATMPFNAPVRKGDNIRVNVSNCLFIPAKAVPVRECDE